MATTTKSVEVPVDVSNKEDVNRAKLYKKIIELRKLVPEVAASKMEQSKQRYNYLSESAMTKALKPAMQQLGLVILPAKVSEIKNEVFTMGERTVLLTTLQTEYALVDADTGYSINIPSVGAGADSLDKGANKANTGAYKNALRALGMFPSPDRDDPDTTPSEPKSTYKRPSSYGEVEIKWHQKYKGQTIQQLFDKDPSAVEELASGSDWLAKQAQGFLDSIR